MRRRNWAALFLFIAGAALLLAGFAMAGFDLDNLNTGGPLVARTYEAAEEVTRIMVREMDADVELVISEDGRARVTCEENEAFCYDITEEDGVLTVEKRDLREARFGLYFGFYQGSVLKIEVPADTAVDVETQNGSIRLTGGAEGLSSPTVSLQSANGSIVAEGLRAGEATMCTSNDDVEIADVEAETLTAATSNGAVTLCGVDVGETSVQTRNGGIRLEDVHADALTARTENDDIAFSGVEAARSIDLETSNGDIRGTLPGSPGDYSVESAATNGENSLPELLEGDGVYLRVMTENGDIDVTFAQ